MSHTRNLALWQYTAAKLHNGQAGGPMRDTLLRLVAKTHRKYE